MSLTLLKRGLSNVRMAHLHLIENAAYTEQLLHYFTGKDRLNLMCAVVMVACRFREHWRKGVMFKEIKKIMFSFVGDGLINKPWFDELVYKT